MSTMAFHQLKLTGDAFQNPRTSSGLDPAAIAELGLHIGMHGVLNPLLVTDDGLVIAGQRRYRAIEWLLQWFAPHPPYPRSQFVDHERFLEQFGERGANLSHEEITQLELRAAKLTLSVPVRVVHGMGLEGIALADNVMREQLSSYEIAVHLTRLHEQGATGVNLARLVGKSATWISRKLAAYRGAGPELRAAWGRGDLTEDAVQRLAELSHAQQAHALALNERPTRGPAHRPPIETVKTVLDDLERTNPPTENSHVLVGQERYAAGVVDALRWVAGKQASEYFARLINNGS